MCTNFYLSIDLFLRFFINIKKHVKLKGFCSDLANNKVLFKCLHRAAPCRNKTNPFKRTQKET